MIKQMLVLIQSTAARACHLSRVTANMEVYIPIAV